MKNKLKYIFIFLGLFFLNLFFSSLIIELLYFAGIDIESFKEPLKSLSLIIIESTLMLIIYLIFKNELENEFKDYKNNFSKYFGFGIVFWLLGVALMLVSNIIIMIIYPSNALNEEAVQSILDEAPIYASFAACLFAPFTEEIIFRKTLHKIFTNNTLFIIASGFIFGLIHNLIPLITGADLRQLLYIIPYGVFGSVFAYMYVKKKNIFIPMTFHLIHNTILVIISLIGG